MLAVAEMLGSHPKVRGWSALVTQNVLHDRELIRTLARLKCVVLFAGLESLDHEMLRRYNKTQNLSRRHNVIDDVAFAESLGIAICYGYLFDYRHQTAAEMERQILAIARNPLMPMPVYLSVVAPLAGTASFWDDLRRGHLAPNLRLRDLDGETICHSNLADRREAIVDFIERMFRRPWTVVPRFGILVKTLRRIVRARSLNPMRWYIIASANFHCFIWSSETPSQARTYVAGDDTLDPQYFERPDDLSEADRIRYFDPVKLTDASGQPAEWLLPVHSGGRRRRPGAPAVRRRSTGSRTEHEPWPSPTRRPETARRCACSHPRSTLSSRASDPPADDLALPPPDGVLLPGRHGQPADCAPRRNSVDGVTAPQTFNYEPVWVTPGDAARGRARPQDAPGQRRRLPGQGRPHHHRRRRAQPLRMHAARRPSSTGARTTTSTCSCSRGTGGAGWTRPSTFFVAQVPAVLQGPRAGRRVPGSPGQLRADRAQLRRHDRQPDPARQRPDRGHPDARDHGGHALLWLRRTGASLVRGRRVSQRALRPVQAGHDGDHRVASSAVHAALPGRGDVRQSANADGAASLDPEFPIPGYPSMDATIASLRADPYNPQTNGEPGPLSRPDRLRIWPSSTTRGSSSSSSPRRWQRTCLQKFYNIRGVTHRE